MVDQRKDPEVISGTVQARTIAPRDGEGLDIFVSTGELDKEQLEDLEAELFYGYGLPDNPDSPRYFITLKKDDGTEHKIMVTQFRVFDVTDGRQELIAWATPELRQKLAQWSADWPKEKDTSLDDLLE
ncbi:MAG: hypothetical protein PHU23_15550, partial [Dehalococcoidales bacterium]|nr:hypothetical protein [Dehalococcoidales bacterium]